MRHMITGGAGFIGCNLADTLLADGEEVTVLDNLSRPRTDQNLRWLQERHGSKLRFIEADIRDAAAVATAIQGHDVVYHLAGQVAVTTSVVDPRSDFEVNALGTLNVLEGARMADHPPIVFFASTNKVYGGMEDISIVEGAVRYSYADLPLGISEAQNLDFHSPYGCCYSADTDILTREGWKKFPELTAADEVLTYSIERDVAEYQLPTAHFAYRYAGKMYVQHNRRLQTCVTPNHKMLVAWDCTHDRLIKPRLIEAEALEGKPMVYLLAADVEESAEVEFFTLPKVTGGNGKHSFPQRSILMDDWLRFLGWYIAEGHCYQNQRTGNCTVTLTTYYRADEAIAVMQATRLSPVKYQHHLTATSRQMYEYVRQFGKSHDKYIPREIKALGKRQLSILLQALLDGDGNAHSKNGWKYTTNSRQLADDVQEIALKCGLAASVRLDREGFYRVYISSTRTAQCNLDQNRSEWIDYDDMVYCVEVPNSTVMVRQNGYAYFSGNSKGAADQYVRDYARIYGLKTVVFRQSCILGPRQFGVEDQGWVAHFVIAGVLGRPLSIFGNGKQVRDLLFVDDLVAAYRTALAQIDRASGQIYNIGGGATNTIAIWTEFGPLLERLLDTHIPVQFGPWRPGDQPIYVSDITKAERELGWRPLVGVEQGVSRLAEWVRANRALFN